MVEDTIGDIWINDEPISYWVFIIPSEAASCNDAIDEMRHICNVLIESFNGLLSPKRMKYIVLDYKTEDNDPYSGSGSYDMKVERSIESEDGITISQFEESISGLNEGNQEISHVKFEDNDLNINLLEGEEPEYIQKYISKSKKEVAAGASPIRIAVTLLPNRSHDKIESDGIFKIQVYNYTDTWFGDSAVDKENRQRLKDVFQQLLDTLQVVAVNYDNRLGSEVTLELE